MTNITIFEPAMCCNTGVCGPSIDQDLLRITAVMDALAELEDYEALRYNLSSNPDQFILNKAVSEKLQTEGMESLPITVVDGKVVKTGGYPSNEEITSYTGVHFIEAVKESGCGAGCDCGSSEELVEAESETRESGCCGGQGEKAGGCCGGGQSGCC